MRHAFIITAYCEFEMLYRQLLTYSGEFDCYVHIDKKSVLPDGMMQKLSELPNVRVISRYKINWGGIQHLYAILDLIEMAVSSGREYGYFHIMSANSVLMKPVSYFHDFFEKNNGKNYMELIHAEQLENPEIIRERYRYYYFQFFYNVRGKHARFWKKFEIYSKKIQTKLGVSRKRKFEYKGYVYCSITKSFADYLLQYCRENRDYIRQLKYCWVCEEFFFQNLLMESPFADTAVNNALIFDLWNEKSRGLPAVLDMRDYQNMAASDKLFARKIGSGASSKELFEKMLEECFRQEKQ